jgi:uncharacterized membrane protein YcaP (DUF421 family)
MKIVEKKHVEKKIAQITVFQIMLILSLPSYAQIIKKTEVNMIYTWIGFVVLMGIITATYIYKVRLNQSLKNIR